MVLLNIGLNWFNISENMLKSERPNRTSGSVRVQNPFTSVQNRTAATLIISSR